jgi:hypothetical protein
MFFQILEHYAHNHFFCTPFFKSFFRFSKMDIFKNVQNRKIFFQIYVKKVKKPGSYFSVCWATFMLSDILNDYNILRPYMLTK